MTKSKIYIQSNNLVCMDVDTLLAKLEFGREVTVSELEQALPSELKPYLSSITKKISNHSYRPEDNVLFLIGVIQFYSNQQEALKIIDESVPSKPNWIDQFKLEHSSFRDFYQKQEKAHRSRCSYNIPHDPKYLRTELDCTNNHPLGGKYRNFREKSSIWLNAIRR